MSSFREYLQEQLKDPEFKREWDNLEVDYNIIQAMTDVGVNNMSFDAFDTKQLDEYAAQAKASWGKTEAYKEYEEKTKDRTVKETNEVAARTMVLFEEFGQMLHMEPGSDEVQQQVKKLQDYITEHFYTCTKEVLSGLGKMYVGGGSMTENIDKAGGAGTAELVAKAIEVYCK